jgi:hypothetical protein
MFHLSLHLLFHQCIAFSQWIAKEITTAKKIKNRINRQSVINTLIRINEFVSNAKYPKGMFIFAGINEYNEKILYTIEPIVKSTTFIYDCSNRFNTHFIQKHMEELSGTVVFVNGNEYYIYVWSSVLGTFKKFKQHDACLQKRQKKGGQSAVRIARLAEETRIIYITNLIDTLNTLTTTTNWIFGSDEMLSLLFERKSKINIKIENGGFLEFDKDTINDTNKWILYIQNNNNFDKYYEKAVLYLDTNIDRLDFDINNCNDMDFFITTNSVKQHDKEILLDINSIYYKRLHIFNYIGIKYYNYDMFENDIII